MNLYRKKYLMYSLVVFMILSVLISCNYNSDRQNDQMKGEIILDNDEGGGKDKQISLDYLICWNGGAAQVPEDMRSNPIAQELAKRTGVTLNILTITTNETEKLNTIFAAGEVPDIVNAPYWTTLPGGEGASIKMAATEGLILALDPYLDNYPNVKRMTVEGISQSYKEHDLEHPDFRGEHYVLPLGTPRTEDDVTHWAYNPWVREDILNALDVDPESIDSSEKLYELMKDIKAGDFKDINGKSVIVSGTWHNGWNYSDFLRSFTRDNVSEWRNFDDGLTYWIFDPMEDQKVLFMRKLISEGLFDQEAYTQTDTVAKEKIATGRVAVLNAHYPNLRDFMRQTVYKTNPEMKYVPVGPFINADGNMHTTKESRGATGSGVLFLSSECKEPEKALEFIDYINSDEGLLLVTYGIEGFHYNMVGGQPEYIEEWKEIRKNDYRAFVNEGLVYASAMIGADPRKGWWPGMEEEDPDYDRAREVNPLVFYDGINANFLARDYPNRQAYEENSAALDYGKEFTRATFEETDEAALNVLKDFRQRLLDAGMDDFIKYMQEEAPKIKDIQY